MRLPYDFMADSQCTRLGISRLFARSCRSFQGTGGEVMFDPFFLLGESYVMGYVVRLRSFRHFVQDPVYA